MSGSGFFFWGGRGGGGAAMETVFGRTFKTTRPKTLTFVEPWKESPREPCN